ncbi:hypothetical protein [Streptomyces sp. NBC_01013]|nr:hypothetical protein OG538_11405 [Streptomyces sp. NBC_01013]
MCWSQPLVDGGYTDGGLDSRQEKHASIYLGTVTLAALVIWLRA